MLSFWRATANKKCYKNWFGGLIAGFFVEGGLYDDSPMLKILNDNIFANADPVFSKDFHMGITDFNEGVYVDLSNQNFTGNK